MIVILDNYTDEDVQILTTHLFRRQLHLFVKDGNVYIGVDIESPFHFNFIANILHCRLLFTPFAFLHDRTRYSVVTLVKEEDDTVEIPIPDLDSDNDM